MSEIVKCRIPSEESFEILELLLESEETTHHITKTKDLYAPKYESDDLKARSLTGAKDAGESKASNIYKHSNGMSQRSEIIKCRIPSRESQDFLESLLEYQETTPQMTKTKDLYVPMQESDELKDKSL